MKTFVSTLSAALLISSASAVTLQQINQDTLAQVDEVCCPPKQCRLSGRCATVRCANNLQNQRIARLVHYIKNNSRDIAVLAATKIFGPRGNRGECGDIGCQGPVGPKGDTGDTGPRGNPGPVGPAGCQGPPGPTGPLGKKGPQGCKGLTGDNGDKGLQGPRGDVGPTGAQGINGKRGYAGSSGDQGDIGPQGCRGPPGQCKGNLKNGCKCINDCDNMADIDFYTCDDCELGRCITSIPTCDPCVTGCNAPDSLCCNDCGVACGAPAVPQIVKPTVKVADAAKDQSTGPALKEFDIQFDDLQKMFDTQTDGSIDYTNLFADKFKM